MARDDRPRTQPAAPPPVPPRRSIVGAAMHDDSAHWLQELDRKLAAVQQATREVIARLTKMLS